MISDFRILSGQIEKYKPALSKLDSSWVNSYCMSLVIVCLAGNPLSVKIIFFVECIYNNFCSNFLLYNVIDFVRMQKSIVESCVDKKFSDRLSSFERCWSSLLRLLMALRRSLLRIDKASLLETFGSLKIRNFGYTSSCLQLLRNSMSNFSLLFLYSNFSYLGKSLTVTFPNFRAISLQIFITFLDSAKLKIFWIKITT